MSPSYDWRRMTEALATQHRPTDPAALAATARQLISTGLTARDVASTLGLSEQAVLTLLATPAHHFGDRNV